MRHCLSWGVVSKRDSVIYIYTYVRKKKNEREKELLPAFFQQITAFTYMIATLFPTPQMKM
jgi:hypothetical protein